LIDGFTQRISFDPKLLGYLTPIVTETEHLLSLLNNLLGQDTAAAPSFASSEKPLSSCSAIFVDGAYNAFFRYPKGLDDIGLSTHPLANKLRGEHPKTLAIVLSVKKHRMNPAKVRPLSILAYHADNIIDRGRATWY